MSDPQFTVDDHFMACRIAFDTDAGRDYIILAARFSNGESAIRAAGQVQVMLHPDGEKMGGLLLEPDGQGRRGVVVAGLCDSNTRPYWEKAKKSLLSSGGRQEVVSGKEALMILARVGIAIDGLPAE